MYYTLNIESKDFVSSVN